jgi:adenylylsulfate kinase
MTANERVSVIWIFGLPSAGKSTVAAAVAARLRSQGRPCLVLDGDELRGGLCRGLGFTEADRSENLRRAAEVALLAVRSGISVVVAMITPLASQRAMIAEILRDVPLQWVWADCPAATCQRRDVKGLYRRQQAGDLTGLTGADGAFEIPGPEALRLDTGSLTVAESVEVLWQQLSLDPPQPVLQITAK